MTRPYSRIQGSFFLMMNRFISPVVVWTTWWISEIIFVTRDSFQYHIYRISIVSLYNRIMLFLDLMISHDKENQDITKIKSEYKQTTWISTMSKMFSIYWSLLWALWRTWRIYPPGFSPYGEVRHFHQSHPLKIWYQFFRNKCNLAMGKRSGGDPRLLYSLYCGRNQGFIRIKVSK